MSTGPSVSSISSKAALEQRRSSDAAFGSPRGGPVPGCHGQVLSVNLDGGWPLSGVGIDVLWRSARHPTAYLAPDRTPLAVSLVGDHASVALPPLPTHSVVVLE